MAPPVPCTRYQLLWPGSTIPNIRKTDPLSMRQNMTEPRSERRVVLAVMSEQAMESAFTLRGMQSVMYINGASAWVQ